MCALQLARSRVTCSHAHTQGRGLHTHAFTHAMERDHHVFMKLEDGTVWCLPDGYQVDDRSLDVIRYVLNPLYAQEQVQSLLARCRC